MALPHFEVATFPSQLFWLVVAAGTTYIFNKLFFIPSLSSSVAKRKAIIAKYKEDIEKIDCEVANIRKEIEEISAKGKNEAKTIIDIAITKSQAVLLNSMQISNKNLLDNMKQYDKYLENYKENLSGNMRFIIDDIKDKVYQLVSMQNM
jgi:F0F1-type ATP synthase membrane subunit b/b'